GPATLPGRGHAVPLLGVRQPHPLRCRRDETHPLVPPLQRERRADRGRRRGPRGGRRGGDVPMVRRLGRRHRAGPGGRRRSGAGGWSAMTVYLHQIHTVQTHSSIDDLFAAVETDYLPLLAQLDVRLVGYWETTALQGRTGEAVSVWELDDYRHLQRLNRALYGPDADGRGLREWRRRERGWVARTES